MENEGRRSPALLSRVIVVVLIVGAVVTGALAFSARARADDQQIILHDEDDDPKTPFFHNRGFFGFHGFGRGHSPEFNSLLAEALGISVEELQEAYATASSAALDQAVTEGFLSEEKADLMKARRALMQYIDKDELLSSALGISVDELQAAYEDVVNQAVRDGVITQDQADQILNGDHSFGGRPGFKFHEGGKFWFKHHPKPETDSDPDSNTNL